MHSLQHQPSGSEPTWHRRHWLATMVKAMTAGALPVGLTACGGKPLPAMRVSCQSWPGYEFLYLARRQAMFSEQAIRLIDVPNATSSIRSLGAKACEAAGLTLDEVITARDRGIPLTVVAVLDFSKGADVLLVNHRVKRLADLKGLSIGVEQSATGAVMLDAVLEAAKLSSNDVKLVSVPVNEHEDFFVSGKVDALVTFEPVKSKLLKAGARVLFSSAEVPGRILDTIAVRTELLDEYQEPLKLLVAGHFNALQKWVESPETYTAALSQRLKLEPADIPLAYAELELPDLSANRRLLGGSNAPLLATAKQLGEIMVRGGLLRSEPDLSSLIDSRFVS